VVVAKSYCGKHYQRNKKRGNPLEVVTEFDRAHYKGSVYHIVDDLVLIEVENTAVLAVVDKAVFTEKGMHKYTYRSNRDGHVRTWVDGEEFFIHQVVLGKLTGAVIDHINGDKLDNRRVNLRHATSQQNRWNKRCRGVQHSPSHRNRPWRASLKCNGKHVLSKFFVTEAEALVVRREAEKKYYGEFAPEVTRA